MLWIKKLTEKKRKNAQAKRERGKNCELFEFIYDVCLASY